MKNVNFRTLMVGGPKVWHDLVVEGVDFLLGGGSSNVGYGVYFGILHFDFIIYIRSTQIFTNYRHSWCTLRDDTCTCEIILQTFHVRSFIVLCHQGVAKTIPNFGVVLGPSLWPKGVGQQRAKWPSHPQIYDV
jgi:hypothetical protein